MTSSDTKELDRFDTKVLFKEHCLRFIVDNTVVQEKQLSEMRKLIAVEYGDQWEEEREFVVLQFTDCLWVVPNSTPLLWLSSDWAEWLTNCRGYYRVAIGSLPTTWRSKGFLGVRSWRPHAAVYPLESLPEWNTKGPLDPKSWDRFLPSQD